MTEAGRLTHAHMGGFALLRQRITARQRSRAAASPVPPLAPGERVLAMESLAQSPAQSLAGSLAQSPAESLAGSLAGHRAGADAASGSCLVATNHALYRRGADALWRRVAWEEAVRVSWDPRRGSLYLAPLTGEPLADTLPVRSPLGTLVRERVAATLLGSRRVTAGSARATIVVRRQPGTGQPVWQVHLAAGVDQDDPELATALTLAIRRLRAEFCL